MPTATATTERTGFETVRLLEDRGPQIRLSPYWVHPPSPRQAVFLSLPHLEALYGGAGGGGKTDALLMGALQYVDVPGYSALLLRRTYAQLTKAGQLLDLSRQWLRGTDARWNDGEAKWIFPSGATIEFGHLDSERDLENFSGPSYQYIGVDELTQFPEKHYRFLFTRLRRTDDVPVPVRMRAATNPGGKGHRWVKADFVEVPRKAGRMFVPAKMRDNPALDHDAYDSALDELDPQTRAQIRDGDWNAREPGNWTFDSKALDAAERLGQEMDTLLSRQMLLPPGADPVFEPAERETYLGVDWGDFRSHGLPLFELERGGLYVPPGEVATTRQDPEEITTELLESAGRYPWWLAEERYDASFAQTNRTFARTAEQHLGPHNPVKRTGRPNTYPVAFGKYKSLSVGYLRFLLRRTLQGHRTRVLAISPHNTILLEQMRDHQQNEDGTFVKGNDDAVDALIAGGAPLAKRHRALVDELEADAKADAKVPVAA